MKTLPKALYLAVTVLIFGCDPGMTIRQGNPQEVSGARTDVGKSPVLIRVKSTRQLIGESLYAPEIQVTNSLKSPITITGIDLASRSGTYTDVFPRPEVYSPKVIQPKDTETLRVLFRLDYSVRKTFEHPAELRLHYRADDVAEGIANTTIVRASLKNEP